MSKSADALEYDVEAARGRLETTLADLSARFNRSSLAEDLIGIRDPGGITPTTEHLAATVRTNPLPVLLIGAGFAFLAYEVVRHCPPWAVARKPEDPATSWGVGRLAAGLDLGGNQKFNVASTSIPRRASRAGLQLSARP